MGKKLKRHTTLRVDESSTMYNTGTGNLRLEPEVDVIDIMSPDGSLYYRINEEEGLTNIMVSEDIDPSITTTNYITIGVVHVY